ncbi:MAG TPA: hypothetical protein VGN08_05755 [Solirubrobacteraceae bacterium]|jgi:hypothetical protein
MRFLPRIVPLATLSALLAICVPAADASFGVTEANFEAGTCSTLLPNCTYASIEKDHGEAFTQAAGHPHWGITTFVVNTKETVLKQQEPEGAVKRIRVDVPPGLAADPEAVPKCRQAEFAVNACKPETEVGNTELIVFDGLTDLPITGTVYNLEQSPGLPLLFGIDIGVKPLLHTHLLLEGHVDWSGDYHEYFEINNVPKESEGLKLATVKSKLNFNGNAGHGNFLTLPSVCSASTTSHLEVESWEGQVSSTPTHTPVGVEGCDKVPFGPTAQVSPQTAQSDAPDGARTEVKVPQNEAAGEINTADIRDAHVTLPEGMTLNPAAARGLQTCSPGQIGIGTQAPVACPAASMIGTVAIETDLPPGSLAGNVYLGNPSGGPITGPPYTIYVDAEAPQYGVSVRLKGLVNTDPGTGRVEASFTENPQLPFSDFIMTLKSGAQAPVANPLVCGSSPVQSLFTPYTGGPPAIGSTPFVTSGCPSPLPFLLTQTTQGSSATAGAYTSYTFNLARGDGQQYLSQVRTVLPPGLVGAIPSVTQCGEPQAQSGACPAASRIGTATVSAGAGPEPYVFSGPVYFTGPYGGAPYGLSIPVAAVAGPFDFGSVITRVGIGVDQHTGRVIATSAIPTIVRGVPLRLRTVSVAVDRASFLFNPTYCGPLATNSTLSSTFNGTQVTSSGFQVSNCNALAFKPTFKVATSSKVSKANGAGLKVNVTQGPHQANIRSVFTQLPLQLPSRLTTLQKACTQATFEANPASCPSASVVGTASATTPVLPGSLTGPAYLVSHAAEAFPNLVLVLQDGGVRVILEGTTDIKKGITTSTFASVPDVPVSSFSLTLPQGPHSALAAFGNLCAHSLIMPTVITAQSGAQFKQATKMSVAGCGIRILRRKVVGHTLLITVRTPGAGRITVSGRKLKTARRTVRKAATTTLRVRLGSGAVRALRSHHRVKIKVRAQFVPRSRSESRSSASSTVTVRH